MAKPAPKQQTIIRAPRDKDHPYFALRRKTVQDSRLSFEARGVLAYLLSKPGDWEIKTPDLMREGDCGRDRVLRILKELEDHGYLSRGKQPQIEGGKFGPVPLTVHEIPHTENAVAVTAEPSTENPSTGNPSTGNPIHTEYRDSQNIEPQKNIADTPSAVSGGESPKAEQPASEPPQDEPPAKPKRKPRPKGDVVPAVLMNPMKDAIAAAFGWAWDGDTPMSEEEAGQIQRAARSLCKAKVTPEQIPSLYAFVKARYENPGPMALTTNVSKWRAALPKHSNGGVITRTAKPAAYLRADPKCPICFGNGVILDRSGNQAPCTCVKAVAS